MNEDQHPRDPDEPCFGGDRLIDLSGLDGAIDPRALLARQVQVHVDELLPHLPEDGDAEREPFLDLLMGFSLSAEALHAAARGEAGTCAEHVMAARRHLRGAADARFRSIWD